MKTVSTGYFVNEVKSPKGLAAKIPDIIFEQFNGSPLHRSMLPEFHKYKKQIQK